MTADENPEVADTPAEAPETEAPQQERQRDEQGRFARQAEPEPKPGQPARAPEAKDEANVPSWRLPRSAKEAERRVAETNAQSRRVSLKCCNGRTSRSLGDCLRTTCLRTRKGQVEYGARQLLTPIEQRIQAMEAKEQARPHSIISS